MMVEGTLLKTHHTDLMSEHGRASSPLVNSWGVRYQYYYTVILLLIVLLPPLLLLRYSVRPIHDLVDCCDDGKGAMDALA